MQGIVTQLLANKMSTCAGAKRRRSRRAYHPYTRAAIGQQASPLNTTYKVYKRSSPLFIKSSLCTIGAYSRLPLTRFFFFMSDQPDSLQYPGEPLFTYQYHGCSDQIDSLPTPALPPCLYTHSMFHAQIYYPPRLL